MTTQNARKHAQERNRGTGRTSRALAEARGAVRAGRSVAYAVHHAGMAGYARALAEQWEWDEVFADSMKLGEARLRIISAPTLRDLEARLLGTHDLLLFDHAFLQQLPAKDYAEDMKALARWIDQREFT